MLKQHLYEHGEDHYEKQGFWWLPSSAEHKVPGTLVFGHSADAELRLLGSMKDSFDVLRSLGGGGAELPPEIILGTTSDGMGYTLIDNVRSGFKMSAYVIEAFLPSVVIEGRHFLSRTEVILLTYPQFGASCLQSNSRRAARAYSRSHTLFLK